MNSLPELQVDNSSGRTQSMRSLTFLIPFLYLLFSGSFVGHLRSLPSEVNSVFFLAITLIGASLVFLSGGFKRILVKRYAPFLLFFAYQTISSLRFMSEPEGFYDLGRSVILLMAVFTLGNLEFEEEVVPSVKSSMVVFFVIWSIDILLGSPILGTKGLSLGAPGSAYSAIYLTMFLFCTLNSRKARPKSLVAALLIVVGIAFIGLRSALACATLVLFSAVLFGPLRSRIRKNILVRLFMALALFSIAILMIVTLVEKSFYEGHEMTWRAFNTNARLHVWGLIIDDFRSFSFEEIIVGKGGGSIDYLLTNYIAIPVFQRPHNDYLKALYDHGIIGLLLFVYLILSPVINRIRQGVVLTVILAIFSFTDNLLYYYAPFGIALAVTLSRQGHR